MSTSDQSPPESAVAKEPVIPPASIRPHDDGDEIKPWDDDHTALVHVLWRCHHARLTLKDDFDEIASRIRRSTYHRAVVAAAFQAGASQNAVPAAPLSAPSAPPLRPAPGRAADAPGPSSPSTFPSDGA